jgi:hypothetical protein
VGGQGNSGKFFNGKVKVEEGEEEEAEAEDGHGKDEPSLLGGLGAVHSVKSHAVATFSFN